MALANARRVARKETMLGSCLLVFWKLLLTRSALLSICERTSREETSESRLPWTRTAYQCRKWATYTFCDSEETNAYQARARRKGKWGVGMTMSGSKQSTVQLKAQIW